MEANVVQRIVGCVRDLQLAGRRSHSAGGASRGWDEYGRAGEKILRRDGVNPLAESGILYPSDPEEKGKEEKIMNSGKKVMYAVTAAVIVALALAGCGGSGGGTGGAGTTTRGPITGFGSVWVNGIEFQTGSATHRKMLDTGEDHSGGMQDCTVLSVGMVVTVHHGSGDDHATEIEYEDNLKGPVQYLNNTDNTFEVLGQKVRYSGKTNVKNGPIDNGFVVEVSGLTAGDNVIDATYIEVRMGGSSEYEIKGYVFSVGSDNTFRLGPLPGISTVTVDITGVHPHDIPGGVLAAGQFVEVKTRSAATGRFPNATIRATEVEGKEDIGHSEDREDRS